MRTMFENRLAVSLMMVCVLSSIFSIGSAFAQNFHGKNHQKKDSQYEYQKSLISFLFPTIKGSGVIMENVRTVQSFHAVIVEDPFHVVVRQGNDYEVRVISDDNLPEYIKVNVSTEGVLTIALDTQNYVFDTLSVIITAPNLDAITLRFGSQTVFESPFVLPILTTNIGLGASIEFREGRIGKHNIRAEDVGAKIDAADVSSDFVTIQASGVGATINVNAKTIDLAGYFGVGARVYYIVGEDRKKPEIIGEKSKDIEKILYPIKNKARAKQYRPISPQDPLMLEPKN